MQNAQPLYTLCKPQKIVHFPAFSLWTVWLGPQFTTNSFWHTTRGDWRWRGIIEPGLTKQTFLSLGSFIKAQHTLFSVASIGIIMHTCQSIISLSIKGDLNICFNSQVYCSWTEKLTAKTISLHTLQELKKKGEKNFFFFFLNHKILRFLCEHKLESQL